MSKYYVLACHASYLDVQHHELVVDPAVRRLEWHRGLLLTPTSEWDDEHPPKEPIEMATEPADLNEEDEEVAEYPEYASQPIPLMSRRLVAALREAGVNNLQTFETILTNPVGTPPVPKDYYFAVNILGLVAAADMKKSDVVPDSGGELINKHFDSLSIDSTKAMGFRLFRLAENISVVLVHERVVEHLDSAGLDRLTWFEPEEWAG